LAFFHLNVISFYFVLNIVLVKMRQCLMSVRDMENVGEILFIERSKMVTVKLLYPLCSGIRSVGKS